MQLERTQVKTKRFVASCCNIENTTPIATKHSLCRRCVPHRDDRAEVRDDRHSPCLVSLLESRRDQLATALDCVIDRTFGFIEKFRSIRISKNTTTTGQTHANEAKP